MSARRTATLNVRAPEDAELESTSLRISGYPAATTLTGANQEIPKTLDSLRATSTSSAAASIMNLPSEYATECSSPESDLLIPRLSALTNSGRLFPFRATSE